MKNFPLINVLLFSAILFNGSPLLAAASTAKPLVTKVEKNTVSEASTKDLRKQNRMDKRFDRFQDKLDKRISKLKKKGKIGASINLDFIGLIVLALGGLFIFLGIVIPVVGILFIVICAIIAFVGLVLLLLLNGVEVSTGDSSH